MKVKDLLVASSSLLVAQNLAPPEKSLAQTIGALPSPNPPQQKQPVAGLPIKKTTTVAPPEAAKATGFSAVTTAQVPKKACGVQEPRSQASQPTNAECQARAQQAVEVVPTAGRLSTRATDLLRSTDPSTANAPLQLGLDRSESARSQQVIDAPSRAAQITTPLESFPPSSAPSTPPQTVPNTIPNTIAPSPFAPPQPAPNTVAPSTPLQAAPNTTVSPFVPPQIVPNAAVTPFITTLPLNGTVIDHATRWQINTDYSVGRDFQRDPGFNAIVKLGGQVTQGISRDNVFTSVQQGSYFQFQTVQTGRLVELLRRDPQTMQGLILQETFTGACLGAGFQTTSDPNAQCTFTPALAIDRASIDPQFFVPTRIEQLGNLGDAVSAETQAILAQPGFQNVGADGQVVGLDLYFPNLGAVPGNSQSTRSSIRRRETIDTTPLLGFSRVYQVLKANDQQAVLGRTVRGQAIVLNDPNTLLNAGLAVAAELLPNVEPQLSGGTGPANANVNRNLFIAANNLRLPDSSWTIYQAGMGRAGHATTNTQGQVVQPGASFNTFWFGFSPITDRTASTNQRFEPTGPERITLAAGGEGGSNSNASFVSNFNGSTIDSASLQNFYTQVYLTFLNRDVDLATAIQFREKTQYSPHLGFSGTFVKNNNLLQYYAGVIAANSVKAYVGAGFTRETDRMAMNLSGTVYSNPDQDYSTNVRGTLGLKVPLSNTVNLTVGPSFRYSLNNPVNPLDRPIDNFVSIGARANVGPVSVGLTQYIGGLLPDSVQTDLGVDASIRLGTRGVLSGYYAPSRSGGVYGVSAEYRFGPSVDSLALAIGWRRDRYLLGQDAFSNSLETNSNIFSILLRIGSDGLKRG